ncbi:Hypothetical protein CINCED_3A025079 [Cinara cedri]|uniref:Uncharacterized protein n=1 Tax=Cinara cedri TaxID=506608 RepID=A0A5E4N0D9_9HEMI|nr:Hypothetical protein CINCED_3A025079 [Cinara cedri]
MGSDDRIQYYATPDAPFRQPKSRNENPNENPPRYVAIATTATPSARRLRTLYARHALIPDTSRCRAHECVLCVAVAYTLRIAKQTVRVQSSVPTDRVFVRRTIATNLSTTRYTG